MVRVERMSFFRHLANCVCSKCGMKRETWLFDKHVNGYVPEQEDVTKFNSQVKERYDINEKKFSYKGSFNA